MACKDPAYRRKYMAGWRKANQEQVRRVSRESTARLRKQALEAYGNKCNCPGCGVTEPKWLAIDHVAGGGNEHRRQVTGHKHGKIYGWLRDHSYPDEFQILCHNCNMAKSLYGACPHVEVSRCIESTSSPSGGTAGATDGRLKKPSE